MKNTIGFIAAVLVATCQIAAADTYVPMPNAGSGVAYGAGANVPAVTNSTAYGPFASANGFQSTAFGMGSTASEYSTAVGAGAYATASKSLAVGNGSFVQNQANGGISIGSNTVKGVDSISIGNNWTSYSQLVGPALSGTASVGIGNMVTVTGDGAIGVGRDVYATTTNAVAIGANSVAAGAGALALVGGVANANTSVAIGTTAQVEYQSAGSVAIGDSAIVRNSATNSVALGAGSVATEANTVAVGNRRISGVADGVNQDDAVTVRQLDNRISAGVANAKKYAAQGVASALAIPTPVFGADDTKSIAMNVGQYDGEVALGVAGSLKLTPSLAFQAGVSAPLASGGSVAAKAGFSWSWK